MPKWVTACFDWQNGEDFGKQTTRLEAFSSKALVCVWSQVSESVLIPNTFSKVLALLLAKCFSTQLNELCNLIVFNCCRFLQKKEKKTKHWNTFTLLRIDIQLAMGPKAGNLVKMDPKLPKSARLIQAGTTSSEHSTLLCCFKVLEKSKKSGPVKTIRIGRLWPSNRSKGLLVLVQSPFTDFSWVCCLIRRRVWRTTCRWKNHEQKDKRSILLRSVTYFPCQRHARHERSQSWLQCALLMLSFANLQWIHHKKTNTRKNFWNEQKLSSAAVEAKLHLQIKRRKTFLTRKVLTYSHFLWYKSL